MSYSTWHFITPFPSFGWLFGNMVLPRFVSMWQGMVRRDMIADDCWTMVSKLVHDWCFITTVFLHYFSRTDLTTSTVPAAHEPVTTFTLTTFNRRPSQPHTSSWRQSLVIPPRSHISVIRQLSWAGHRLASSFRRPSRTRTATCTFYVLAAHELSTSAVLLRGAPRHISPSTWATSSLNNSNLLICRYALFSRTLTTGSTEQFSRLAEFAAR